MRDSRASAVALPRDACMTSVLARRPPPKVASVMATGSMSNSPFKPNPSRAGLAQASGSLSCTCHLGHSAGFQRGTRVRRGPVSKRVGLFFSGAGPRCPPPSCGGSFPTSCQAIPSHGCRMAGFARSWSTPVRPGRTWADDRFEIHAPIARAIAGFAGREVSDGPVGTPQGLQPGHRPRASPLRSGLIQRAGGGTRQAEDRRGAGDE